MADEPTIDGIDVAAYDVPTDYPEADGTLDWDATTVVVVHASAAGTHGLGWTYASAAAARVVRDHLEPVVVGRSALEPAAANSAMARTVRNVGRPGVAACAISAVDIALWDLRARLLGHPLVHLLGGAATDVPVYGSGGFTTYDDDRLRDQLAGWVGTSGVAAVKLKIGESWGSRVERDLERVAVARATVGDRVEVFVDANGAYGPGQAVRVGARLDELAVTWFEEPVSSDDLNGLARVRASVRADVAAGEYGYEPTYFARMLAADAVDCLQIDVTRCGGVSDFLRVAGAASAHPIDVSAHCAPHLHAHVAAATRNLRHVEYFHDHVRIEEQILFDGASTPTNGTIAVRSDVIGHGMSLREPDAERLRVA